MQKLLSRASAPKNRAGVGATSRRHHPNPAEAHRRWRGRGAEPVRLGARDHHTRSLCAQSPAQTEQWCCWFSHRRIIFGSGRKSRQFLPSQRLTNARASIPAEILALGPSCVSPIAAAQTRIVSVAGTRLGSRQSERLFKGIICDDVSEIAVGTLITQRPPHRSVRAQFGHTAPTLGV